MSIWNTQSLEYIEISSYANPEISIPRRNYHTRMTIESKQKFHKEHENEFPETPDGNPWEISVISVPPASSIIPLTHPSSTLPYARARVRAFCNLFQSEFRDMSKFLSIATRHLGVLLSLLFFLSFVILLREHQVFFLSYVHSTHAHLICNVRSIIEMWCTCLLKSKCFYILQHDNNNNRYNAM